ncbi:O-antigen ligase family protein [Alphaproteobacteria bacterium]|nr:O-antigen ligase family protein [Alphaproteobacteria bacterium]
MNKADQILPPSITTVFWYRWAEFIDVLRQMSPLERAFHLFWLAGPFIMLVERTPADVWLSVLSLAFVVRSIVNRDGSWLRLFWVRACFLFLAVCILSSAASLMPVYALTETIVWFRFPLFAMATVFWLGKDRRLLYAMVISTALGMIVMTGILTVELLIEGQKHGRLMWPYGDKVSGNYLAKVGLPAFTVMAALAIGAKPKLASVMAVLSVIILTLSLFAGERINFLIIVCGGMLAALAWKPNWRRYTSLIVVEIAVALLIYFSSSSIQTRFVKNFFTQIPIGPDSSYYRTISAGYEAAKETIFLGLGPANFRELCPQMIVNKVNFTCHNHPHNFYSQLLSETGVIGLVTGSVMIISIIWATFMGWRKNRADVVSAAAFVVPFGLFFPIQSTADFFGQWNNIFMWSAIALALAAAQTLALDKSK